MRQALALAQQAATAGEVPVGAVVVREGVVLGEGRNSPIALHDPTAHAEMQALRVAAQTVSNYRIPGTTLYSTLEPCPMCAGAMIHARVARLVFAAYDLRSGAATSQFTLLSSRVLNHQVVWEAGLLQAESAALLQTFFRDRR